MKEKHFRSLELQALIPPFSDVTQEIRMGELDIIESEGSIPGRNQTLDFQLDRPVISPSKGKNSSCDFIVYKHKLLWYHEPV